MVSGIDAERLHELQVGSDDQRAGDPLHGRVGDDGDRQVTARVQHRQGEQLHDFRLSRGHGQRELQPGDGPRHHERNVGRVIEGDE